MYNALRSRQVINQSSIHPRRQRFSTCIAYRAPGKPFPLCYGSRPDYNRSVPRYAYASTKWKAEQRRKFGDFGQEANDKCLRTNGLSYHNGRTRSMRALAESRRQNFSLRSFSCSHGLHATEFQDQAKISDIHPVSVDLGNPPKHDTESNTVKLNIRERLRKWEVENSRGAIQDVMVDLPKSGKIQNTAVASSEGYVVDPEPDDANENNGTQLLSEQGELVDLGNNRPFLLKGDMVELNLSNHRQPELAICVRQFESYTQFYTMSGKWVNRNSNHILFYVSRFVAPEDVDGLLPYLPATNSPPAEQNKLQNFENALPREIGAPLIEKMLRFWQQTEEVYRDFADSLDKAYQSVVSDNVLRYYTLQQLASMLLPRSVRLPNGQFPIPVLYAVHRAVSQCSFGFRTEVANHRHGSRNGGRYEVIPKIENTIAERVTGYVREFQEMQTTRKTARGKDSLPLAKFVIKAQRLIDTSRKHRELTNSGTLGPYKGATDQATVSPAPSKADDQTEFTDTDIEIIRFLESWVAMRNFGANSAANGIGSLILRAIHRYNGFDLDPTTAWTFLQEIGILAPWDHRVAFDLRLPKAGFQLSAEEDLSQKVAQSGANIQPLKDRMDGLRKDWASLPVYCVDDIGAQEIDDGVSLEKIGDSLDEYWVHIHTADPASHIEPSSDIARNAERMASSVYLPERVVSMIPKETISSLFSLANDRPSLTFSAKMNNSGDILDIKVTPGYVRNVKFITPSVVDEIVSGTAPPEKEGKTYTVGGSMLSGLSRSNSKPERNMLQATELTDEDKENLQKLSSLGLARRQKALQRGAIPTAASNLLHARDPSISVQLNEEVLPPSSWARYYNSDPTIKFNCSALADVEPGMGEKTITALMLLGGEISARWCHNRGIPIPYRISPQNPERPDAATYLRETVMPALKRPGEAARRVVEGYLYLVGRVALSTTPGPHLLLGVSKFAKCTSPLRRYGDLLVHWQVEAALLEEARTGQSLVGSTRTEFLPFSRDSIEDLIPTLDCRERAIRKAHKDANYSWAIQFVLRAWKFKECMIPQTFECVVRQIRIGLHETVVIARINFLGIPAHFELPEWIKGDDIKVGDIYECEFSDVNFYLRKIFLKPLRRINVGDGLEGI